LSFGYLALTELRVASISTLGALLVKVALNLLDVENLVSLPSG
jgi:hypothetical protein